MGVTSRGRHRGAASTLTLLSRRLGGGILRVRGAIGEEVGAGAPRAHRAGELLHRLLLLLAQLLGNVDDEAVVDVASLRRSPPPAAAELRGALSTQALHRPVGGSGAYAQGLGGAEGGDLHLGAAQRLGDAQVDLHLEVVSLALEDR